MEQAEMTNALEAVLFAAGEPLGPAELQLIIERSLGDEPAPQPAKTGDRLKAALADLKARWDQREDGRGFTLVEVGGGLTFRSNPRYGLVIRAMKEKRPVRPSRAALETLAIVAYRQPATRPDIDQIRGVDSGGTLRWLLDRDLVRIVGKKEEPGRPLLYGTTSGFLNFFSLSSLSELPPLKDYHELTDDSREELAEFDTQRPTLQDLSHAAKHLTDREEPAVEALEEALEGLDHTAKSASEAFASEGISLQAEKGVQPAVTDSKGKGPALGPEPLDAPSIQPGEAEPGDESA